jgi:glutaryl-CoA dehydrogenase (non-decarboxylating)
MQLALSPYQRQKQEEFRNFAASRIAPGAEEADRLERTPRSVIQAIAEAGYLGSLLSEQWGGLGLDPITYGLLHEEIGKGCASARSLITVHDVVAYSISRWGTEEQRKRYLPAMTRGERVGAFAITEPEAGSDMRRIGATATSQNSHYLINGVKKWITFGQMADVFLVLCLLDGSPTTFLVDRSAPGVFVRPITGLLGMRASMCAEIVFEQCQVGSDSMIGRPGFGLSAVVLGALSLGRYGVAWGCVAIAQACVDACLLYADRRVQFGHALREHQLVQELLTDMIVDTEAARLLCFQAGYYRAEGDPNELPQTLSAKYFASRIAMRAASSAVQIHGANGCGSEYPVQRYLRDAKIMEIIEGSSQMQQIMIAKLAYQSPGRTQFAPTGALAEIVGQV